MCLITFPAETTKFGILELDKDRRVTAFLEKPDLGSTLSRWAVSAFGLQVIPQ